MPSDLSGPRVAEFFAGIGLVRMALEKHGFDVVWANDIDTSKRQLYARNFDDSHFVLKDVRVVRGGDLPDVHLATASFPCTDLSLAGNRLGLNGTQSSMFWQFARILREMRHRRPYVVMLENVPSFGSSHNGADLHLALQRLNRLGYWCDLMVLDARHFVPQSRPRLFIIGSRAPLCEPGDWSSSPIRPAWIGRFVRAHPNLQLNALPLSLPVNNGETLADMVERMPPNDGRWWNSERQARFVAELSPIQHTRLASMKFLRTLTWATAYRRTRVGKPAWEIRPDAISGCLRTARGGSSKQAVVEVNGDDVRVRWMTAREYARLQGAPGYHLDNVTEGKALFGFGDAVCVPVVSWLTREYLLPLLSGELTSATSERRQDSVRA